MGLIAFGVATLGCSKPVGVALQPLAPLPDGRPRLLVLVVFDQFRGDYVERWSDLFGQEGIERLKKEGIWFTNCHYPYATTITGCGHASILTGCSPNRHGIIENEWFDRQLGKMVYCASNEFRQTVYTVPAPTDPKEYRQGGTPERLMAESLGDTLRAGSHGESKVVAVSLKDRSACLPGGKDCNEAYWFDSRTGTFVTSTYYRDRCPEWVAKFNREKLADRWLGKAWERLLPNLDYVARSGPDDVIGETAGISKKMERTFPHPLSKNKRRPDKEYYDEVTCSPYGNELLWEFAKVAIDNTRVGRGTTTDLLTISFSANDIAGHSFGPDSQEVLDLTLRSDLIVAEILKFLDTRVGVGQYVLALTSDHGICPLPEVAVSKGLPGLRLHPDDLKKRGEMFLDGVYGTRPSESSKWIEADAFPWVYLNHRKIESRGKKPNEVAEVVARWFREQPWAERAYTRADLETPKRDDDDITVCMRKAYYPERAGDLAIVFKPYVISQTYESGTTHGSPFPYDTHVPLFFFGQGIQAKKSSEPVTPQSVAAVFARAARVKPPAKIDVVLPLTLAAEAGK